MKSILTVALHSEHDVVLARRRVRQVASCLGCDTVTETRLATAVSELARNALQYGVDGKVELRLERRTGAATILWIVVRDHGPGIPDLESVLEGDYRSPTGLGLGLRGARRLVDHFSIESRHGSTRVELGQELDHELDDEALSSLLVELRKAPPGDAMTEILHQNQELLQTQQELAEANRALEHADRAKSHFLSMLGHELRNLLNALRGSLEVLRRSPDEYLRERMETLALGQTEHLRRLVDDLLDASRIDRGQLEVRAAPVDLTREIELLVESWREKISRTGLRLKLVPPAEASWVLADSTRLTQIFGNLISNACKFTDPGGEIRIEIERRDEAVRVAVADTGCGMDPDALEKIFEPFAQTEEASRRMTGGLGLGLSIVRALVDAHGGRLWAESEGHGRGSRFIVELPMIETPSDTDTVQLRVHEETATRVLLVDDHQASVEALAELLRLEGHEVEVALDGPSALEQVEDFTPKVVLCDLGLPGMNGFEVARELRRRPGGTDLLLIAFSGFTDEASKHRAGEAGFDAHLDKPIDVPVLTRYLNRSPPG